MNNGTLRGDLFRKMERTRVPLGNCKTWVRVDWQYDDQNGSPKKLHWLNQIPSKKNTKALAVSVTN